MSAVAPGVYASRLAHAGYGVNLIDLLSLHVEQRRRCRPPSPVRHLRPRSAKRAIWRRMTSRPTRSHRGDRHS